MTRLTPVRTPSSDVASTATRSGAVAPRLVVDGLAAGAGRPPVAGGVPVTRPERSAGPSHRGEPSAAPPSVRDALNTWCDTVGQPTDGGTRAPAARQGSSKMSA